MGLSTESQLIKEFIGYKRMNEGRSESTCYSYSRLLNGFYEYIDSIGKDLKTISTADIENYVGSKLYNTNRKASTRRVALSAIKEFYKWLNRRYNYPNHAAIIHRPFNGLRLPKAASIEQATRILAMPNLSTFIGLRDIIILMMMMGMGLRRNEVCLLNQEDLFFDGKQQLFVTVNGKGSKQRIVPAPSEVSLLLRAYLNHPDFIEIDRHTQNGYRVLFISTRRNDIQPFDYIGDNRRISTKRINAITVKYSKMAGVNPAEVHPHAFRHLFGKQMTEGGVDTLIIKALMGHANISTTELYAHISTGLKTIAIQSANPLTKIHNPISELVKSLASKSSG